MKITPLASPAELRALFPLSESSDRFIQRARREAKEIIEGKSCRRALIIGPCSIHDPASALEYASRFQKVTQAVEEHCLLVMRVYVEKPRTAVGWKGLLYDPRLDASHDIQMGLVCTRQLLLALAEMQIAAATEFVDPLAALYFEDLITWGFIGARTAASPLHRQFASRLLIPIGFKNSTDGSLEEAIYGVLSARTPQAALHLCSEGGISAIQTAGNPSSHLVLRGGYGVTNYDRSSVEEATQKLRHLGLPTRVMIDCSHGNSQKQHERQTEVFHTVLEQIKEGNDSILGIMVESHLEEGSQPFHSNLSSLIYGVSITDPCLGWNETEELIYCADSVFSSVGGGVVS